MDYKTIVIVVILLGLPTIVLVIAKLISMIRQTRINQTESESGVYGVDRESGEIGFGDGESGKRPPTSSDDTRASYEHGVGESQSDDPGITTMAVFDYLEEAVTCRDPASRESFEELPDEDTRSDGNTKDRRAD